MLFIFSKKNGKMYLKMKYKTKNKGISLLIALGGSFLVLLVAFATLLSVDKMLSQMASLERSTKLFFAAESGVEAAFYHHNARGGGIDFLDIGAPTGDSQKIPHLNDSINAEWTVDGRSDDLDSGAGVNAPIIGLLKEGQTVQIPLSWDNAAGPEQNTDIKKIGGISNDYFQIKFYRDSDDMDAEEQAIFENLFGGRVNIIENVASFDFGKDNADPNKDEILIDWSISRINDNEGIQTFSPIENDCAANEDFICEDLLRMGTVTLDSSGITDTKATDRLGRVLPGYTLSSITLDSFIECTDDGAGEPSEDDNCSDYILTFRPLLKFSDTNGTNGDASDDTKIPGIPYIIRAGNGSSNYELPKQNYTVDVAVSEGNFSQRVSIEVPEKTAIGAFDYVIFD